MPSYQAPVRDTLFLLNDVFPISRYANLPGFSDLTPRDSTGNARRGGEVCRERYHSP